MLDTFCVISFKKKFYINEQITWKKTYGKTWFNDTVTRRLPSIFCHRICTCISAKQIQLLTAEAKVAKEKNRKSKLTLKNVSTNWLLLLDRRVHYKNETVMKLTFLFGKTCYNIKVCATK